MTLKEMKIKTFSLIEEYYPELADLAEDEDVLNKINNVINQVQMDLMQFRKINKRITKEIKQAHDNFVDLTVINDLYQIDKIYVKPYDESMDITYDFVNNQLIEFDEDFRGYVMICYFAYPTQIQVEFDEDEDKEEYDETYTFDIDRKLLEIMPYGVARDLLRLDMISSYGSYFEKTYNELIQRLDSRRTSGMVSIEGGID